MNTSVIYKALKCYENNLLIFPDRYSQYRLNSIHRCLDYLNNGGIESKEWILNEYSILIEAMEFYRNVLKEELYNAMIADDKYEMDNIRNERNLLNKYINFIKKYS